MAVSLVSTGVQFPDTTIQTTAATAGGKAVNVQTFDSSGTWTKPSGYGANSRVFIQVWGGGGGGGDSLAGSGGGGGGGGAYNERWIGLSSMGSTEIATVGAGGTRGTSFPGAGTGGTTSLGTLVYAYGGGGGAANGGESENFGGGGGGQMSSGIQGVSNTSGFASIFSGRPWLTTTPRSGGSGSSVNNAAEVSGSVQGNRSLNGKLYDAFWHGGGGGKSANTTGGPGSNTVFGGGGGGAFGQAGGTSQIGGNGGTSPGGAPTAPGGGGASGTSASTAASAGAAGRIIVTVFDGA